MNKKNTTNEDLILSSLTAQTIATLERLFPNDGFMQCTTSSRIESDVQLLRTILDSEVAKMESYFTRVEASYLCTFYVNYIPNIDNPDAILKKMIMRFEDSVEHGPVCAWISNETPDLEVLRKKMYQLSPIQAWAIQCNLMDYVNNPQFKDKDISELMIVSKIAC